jgi:SAM-dependent methyltransferase
MKAKAEHLPLRSNSIDVIVATDILEHLDDDIAALQEFHRVLKPGGFAVITVPAFGLLWSEHDLALMHHRRYTAPQLAARCTTAGFHVTRTSYALWLLFPFAVITRLLRRKDASGPQAHIPRLPAWLNRLLIHIQQLELRLLDHMNLPWGVSIAAIIHKPVEGAEA